MKFNFRIIKKDITKEPYYDELFFNPYIEIIKMKFLNCNYSEDIDADIVLECFDSNYQDYPILSFIALIITIVILFLKMFMIKLKVISFTM